MNASSFRPWSSIGKKLFNGLTGIFLMLFIIAHLAGNLTLLVGADAFNGYAEWLHRLGAIVPVMEVGLLALVLAHVVSAVAVYSDRRAARTIRYAVVASKGGASKQTVFSRSMILTGAVLLVFLVLHIWQFRFGPSIAEGYSTVLHGEPVRDLYRLVVETFQNPLWLVFYLAVTVLLGFHLRHGFWSAFQSLGVLTPRTRALAYSAGGVFAIVMVIGFLTLPLWLFFAAEPQSARGIVMVVP